MPRSRFARLPPERREAILDVAARHFAEGGFEGASYNRILEDAGLSKSSAYYLFEGKADLYSAVLERETAGLVTDVPPPSAPPTAEAWWAATRAWLEDTLALFVTRPTTAALLIGYAEARRRGAVPDVDRKLEEVLDGAVDALLESGRAVGAVRTDLELPLLAAIVGAALGALDQHFMPEMRLDQSTEPVVAVYLDVLRRLLTPA